jgi:hypothetical protein
MAITCKRIPTYSGEGGTHDTYFALDASIHVEQRAEDNVYHNIYHKNRIEIEHELLYILVNIVCAELTLTPNVLEIIPKLNASDRKSERIVRLHATICTNGGFVFLTPQHLRKCS